jgi:hypothetical protein
MSTALMVAGAFFGVIAGVLVLEALGWIRLN